MKIVIVHNTYQQPGGEDVAVAAESNLLEHRGHTVIRYSRSNHDVDGYVALTNFARDKFIEGGLPASRIGVKPNFLESDPGKRSSSSGFALFVGRLSAEKGAEVLLQAWQKLKATIPLVILGDGPLRKPLESEAAARKLSNITFAGWRSRGEILSAMKSASLLI